MKPFSLISLQIKTPAQVKLYISIVCFTIVLGLVLFVFNKRLRSSVIDYVNNHVFFVSIFSAFYLTYLVTRIFFVNTVFKSLFQEDGFFEYLTTLFFLLASLFFLLAFIKSKGNANSYTRIFIFGLLLFCFIIGMEEISWGQRILGIETPESFRELNYQDETTVHNLISPTYHPLLYLTFSLLCLVFFAFTNSKYDSLIWIN